MHYLTRPHAVRTLAGLGVIAAILTLGATRAGAQAPSTQEPQGRQNTIGLAIEVPKGRFDPGERFRACIRFPAPASVVLTQKMQGQREFFLFRRFVGDRSTDLTVTERRECFGVVAGSTNMRCTYDVVGIDTTPCVSGESGTECLQLVVLSALAYTSDGGQRLVLVQETSVCYTVG